MHYDSKVCLYDFKSDNVGNLNSAPFLYGQDILPKSYVFTKKLWRVRYLYTILTFRVTWTVFPEEYKAEVVKLKFHLFS